MSANLIVRPTKGSYFVAGAGLYYVVDKMPDESHYLIENCYTNEAKWIDTKDFTKQRKEVIKLANSHR